MTIIRTITIWLFILLLQSCSAPSESNTEAETITAQQFKKQYSPETDVIIDVRTPEEYQQGHLKAAKNVDYTGGEFEQKFKNWDKSKTYYLHCASGNRSGKAAKMMAEDGFEHVYNIGGYEDMKKSGLPAE
ncbi:MAG: rhodanese-like domain-containing protein [Hymenobacteraceae bacterium]|nr:rhodanese-like domain-containing protein [Hymenobacteraceae bacterium]MDX5396251.1 rhodanese-like domain-containing protein [Hymenobacteraceae bacterium]MDX5443248.1 rhodanese-like domain-containing protein [Hymenobacteraceae bacterium]MDX5512314.1 rhodanese-like domain-containing protein [Hymenobacteraceae bacterium]